MNVFSDIVHKDSLINGRPSWCRTLGYHIWKGDQARALEQAIITLLYIQDICIIDGWAQFSGTWILGLMSHLFGQCSGLKPHLPKCSPFPNNWALPSSVFHCASYWPLHRKAVPLEHIMTLGPDVFRYPRTDPHQSRCRYGCSSWCHQSLRHLMRLAEGE